MSNEKINKIIKGNEVDEEELLFALKDNKVVIYKWLLKSLLKFITNIYKRNEFVWTKLYNKYHIK